MTKDDYKVLGDIYMFRSLPDLGVPSLSVFMPGRKHTYSARKTDLKPAGQFYANLPELGVNIVESVGKTVGMIFFVKNVFPVQIRVKGFCFIADFQVDQFIRIP